MKDISCSGVHRKRTWVGSASRTPFYRWSIGRGISEWGDSRRHCTTVTKINNAVIIGSEDDSGWKVLPSSNSC